MSLYDPAKVMKLGHEQIDREHLQFVSLLNDLHDAIISGRGNVALRSCISELLILTSEHFYLEERLMEETGYPNLKKHSEDHWAFYRKLVSYVDKLNSQETVAIEFISVLMGWFVNHVQKSDLDYVAYFEKFKMESSSERFEPLLSTRNAV